MNLKTISSAAVSGAIALTIVIGAPTTAHAAVSAKDTASQSDIVKAVPDLADGTFKVTKTKEFAVPGKTCGATEPIKAKSGVNHVGASATGFPVVTTAAAEFASASRAKKYLAAYAAFVKKCATFTEPTTGATVTVQSVKAPKLADASIAATQVIAVSGITSYSGSVVIRDGKRIAVVAVIDDAAVPTSQTFALAKVAAKKLK